jgi:site-specific recombinase XerC
VSAARAAARSAADHRSAVPPRAEWPEPQPQSAAGAALTDVIIETFRLNGRLLEVAQGLAAEGDITAAWWQVLGAVLDEPRTVAEIGRRMGLTRQGVQRIADLLVARGLAEASRAVALAAISEYYRRAVHERAIAANPCTFSEHDCHRILWVRGKGETETNQPVPLNAPTIAALEAWLAERARIAGTTATAGPLLISPRTGRPLRRQAIRGLVEPGDH